MEKRNYFQNYKNRGSKGYLSTASIHKGEVIGIRIIIIIVQKLDSQQSYQRRPRFVFKNMQIVLQIKRQLDL